jgi:hypothetical protein
MATRGSGKADGRMIRPRARVLKDTALVTARNVVLVAFIRAGFDRQPATAVKVGNAGARPGALRRQGRQCAAPATASTASGPRTAPDLSDIGAIRTPAALQRSLLDPTAAMMPINRPVRASRRTAARSRPPLERRHLHRAADRRQERLLSLDKIRHREYELGKTSPMPSFAASSRRRAGRRDGVSAVAEGTP